MLSVILKTYKIKNESISSKNEVIKLFVNKYVEEKYLNHDLLKIFIIYDNEEHKNSNEIKMQYVLAYTINQNKKTNVQMEEIKKEYTEKTSSPIIKGVIIRYPALASLLADFFLNISLSFITCFTPFELNRKQLWTEMNPG